MRSNRKKRRQKKLKVLTTIFLSMLAALCLNAQTTYPSFNIGAKVGMNRSNIIFTGDALGANFFIRPAYTIHFGAVGEMALFKKLAIQSELVVNRKGFEYPEELFINHFTHYKMIDIPIMVKFSNLQDFDLFTRFIESDKINASLMLGPTFSLVRNVAERFGSEKNKYTTNEYESKKGTWGLTVAASTEYTLDNWGIIGLQVGGQLGLEDIDTRDNVSQTPINYYMSVVYYPQILKKIFNKKTNAKPNQ